MITLTGKDVLPEDGASGRWSDGSFCRKSEVRPWPRFVTTACSTSARSFPP